MYGYPSSENGVKNGNGSGMERGAKMFSPSCYHFGQKKGKQSEIAPGDTATAQSFKEYLNSTFDSQC